VESKCSHICVCVCTFRRPELLEQLLAALQHQLTDDAFTYSVVVVDNDEARSAEAIAMASRARGPVQIDYYTEPHKSIPLARNKAVQHGFGDFVAFVDDDEVPVEDWLLRLYEAADRYGADAVLGPVTPRYTAAPPDWLVKCKFFDRPRCPSGTVLSWRNTRTGNVLLSRRVFDGGDLLFRPEFRHSEDQDFFQRIIARGRLVVWCDEAVVYEIEGVERLSVRYFLRRALLRGNVSLRLPSNKLVTVSKSTVAFALYTAALLPLAMVRRDLAILYLTKSFDHLGKLMAACGIDVQRHLT
jgi:succinoglycan biosynthesis protein ExoM